MERRDILLEKKKAKLRNIAKSNELIFNFDQFLILINLRPNPKMGRERKERKKVKRTNSSIPSGYVYLYSSLYVTLNVK